MLRVKLYPVVGVAVLAAVAGVGLFFISNGGANSSPDKSIAGFVDAESRADLATMENASSKALFQNFLGKFGEAKFREVRGIYQEAYDLADPKWEQYREKAQIAAEKEHQSIAAEIDKKGRDAVAAMPADQKLQLMDDRAKFNDFIFEEGLKALPSDARGKIADPRAFRENRDIQTFTDHEGFALLPEEDRSALKSPAALSATLTPERVAFLESVGLPQLTAKQRETIAGISSSELNNPQDFMVRNGRESAQAFLKDSGLDPKVTIKQCDYLSQNEFGSLFKGNTASCVIRIRIRGAERQVGAVVLKQSGAWKISSLFPMLNAFPEAYPPRPVGRVAVEEPVAAEPSQAQEAVESAPAEVSVQRPRIPPAKWVEVPDPGAAALARDAILVGLSHLFPVPMTWLTTALLVLLAIALFCVVMTINFRRLRKETFVPEWLEGEIQLEEIQVSHWWSSVWLRLTNKRIIQVRLSWFFSRRTVFGVALDDIHSATWRRYSNWLLILVGICLFGRTNPIALILLMWGLESRILSIRFSTPLAQMPFPRARASVTSFRRQQFNELATFYKKAQLYLAQVRTQKQLPVQSSVTFIPEEDKDFSWSLPVWIFVAVWLLVALGQRTFGDHVTLEGIFGGLVLGLPVAAAMHSLRSGVWTGVLGAAALVAVKFPGSVGLLLLAKDGDGGSPNLLQYIVLLLGAVLIAAAAYGLSRVHPLAGFVAPLLWLIPIAVMQRALPGELQIYATCLIAIASAAAFFLVSVAAGGNWASLSASEESAID